MDEDLYYRHADIEILNHPAARWSSPENFGCAKVLVQCSRGLAMTVKEIPGAASTPQAAT
jgi:hypothetical protein